MSCDEPASVLSSRFCSLTLCRQLCRLPIIQTGGHRHSAPAAEPRKQESDESRRSGFSHAAPEEPRPLMDDLSQGEGVAPLGQQNVPLPAQPSQVVPTLVPSQVVPPPRRQPSQSHAVHTSQCLKETILDITCQSPGSFDDKDDAPSSIASPEPTEDSSHSLGNEQPSSQQVRQYVCALPVFSCRQNPFLCSAVSFSWFVQLICIDRDLRCKQTSQQRVHHRFTWRTRYHPHWSQCRDPQVR
jgi:hypothetical protein